MLIRCPRRLDHLNPVRKASRALLDQGVHCFLAKFVLAPNTDDTFKAAPFRYGPGRKPRQ